MKHIDLFSGIGGFSLAVDTIWHEEKNEHIFVENDDFPQAVLHKHWKDAIIYNDIKDVVWLLSEKSGIEIGHAKINQNSKGIGNPITQNTAIGFAKRQEKDAKNNDIKNENLSLPATEENVDVVERVIGSFSPLTIKMAMERANVSYMGTQDFITESSKEITQKTTNFSATTATLLKEYTKNALTKVDLITGGFPCQPFSQAGKRAGTADSRWLWPEMFRIIQLTQPKWVIAENVSGFANWGGGMAFETVCADLESAGYEVQPFRIPAVAVGAPHRRDRWWFVAHATDADDRGNARELPQENEQQTQERQKEWTTESCGADNNAENPISERSDRRVESSRQVLERGCTETENARPSWEKNWVEVATRLCGVFNGLSSELDETGLITSDGIYSKYASLTSKISRQDLPHLWHLFQSQQVQWKIGRFDTIQQQDYLFTVLWQLTHFSEGQDYPPFESAEVQEAYLRNVWRNKEIGCPPQGWRYKEQYAEEHRDTLSSLSYEVALVAEEVWKAYLKDRNPRLKALGNAIVPQVAMEIMQAIKKHDRQQRTDSI